MSNRRKRSTFKRNGYGLSLCPYRYASLFNTRPIFDLL